MRSIAFTAALAVLPVAAPAATLTDVSTSLSKAVDINGNPVDFDDFVDFARFENAGTVDGQSIDLIAELRLPDAADFGPLADQSDNGTTRVGLAGAGLKFENLERGLREPSSGLDTRLPPDTVFQDFIIDLSVVESGTSTIVPLDEFGIAFRDLDDNESFIGTEFITLSGVSEIETVPGQQTVTVTDPVTGTVTIEPTVLNNSDVAALFRDVTGPVSIGFLNHTGGSGEVNGGFNIIGSANANFGAPTETISVAPIPLPAPALMLVGALGAITAVKRRARG